MHIKFPLCEPKSDERRWNYKDTYSTSSLLHNIIFLGFLPVNALTIIALMCLQAVVNWHLLILPRM